jgi:hypothetical protein
MTRPEVLREIRRRADEVGGTAALARAWKVSKQYLTDVLHDRKPPGPAILDRLGLEVAYVPKTTRR